MIKYQWMQLCYMLMSSTSYQHNSMYLSTIERIFGYMCIRGVCKEYHVGGTKSMEGVDEATMEVLNYVALKYGTKLNSIPIPIFLHDC